MPDDQNWDGMFLDQEEKAAAYEIADTHDKIETGLRNVLNHVRPEADFNRVRNFQNNLEYIHDWDQREMLGLLIRCVDLHEVDFDFLDKWRACYQIPPEE